MWISFQVGNGAAIRHAEQGCVIKVIGIHASCLRLSRCHTRLNHDGRRWRGVPNRRASAEEMPWRARTKVVQREHDPLGSTVMDAGMNRRPHRPSYRPSRRDRVASIESSVTACSIPFNSNIQNHEYLSTTTASLVSPASSVPVFADMPRVPSAKALPSDARRR